MLGRRGGRRVRHARLRVRRGTPARPGAAKRLRRSVATGRSTRRRRSSAGRWRSSRTTRACCSTSRRVASCTWRWRLGCPASACTLHGNNKSSAELRQALEAGVKHVIVDSFDEFDRIDALIDGWRRCGARRRAADHARRERAHPRVHLDRPERLEVRLQPRERRRPSRRRPRPSLVVGRPRRRALPHRVERVRSVVVREGGRGDGRLRGAARPARTRPRRWARRRLRRRGGGALDHPVGQRAARRLSSRSASDRVSASSRVGPSSRRRP